MKALTGIKYNRIVLGLFLVGLMATAVALFGITYLGSLSIAETEIERQAEKESALAGLVFENHLKQLEGLLRTAAADRGLIDAVKARKSQDAIRILEQLGQISTGPQPDVLILDHEEQMGWLNASLTLVDVSAVLPGQAIKTMPPDVWRLYSDDNADPPIVVAIISIPVVDPTDRTGHCEADRRQHRQRFLLPALRDGQHHGGRQYRHHS